MEEININRSYELSDEYLSTLVDKENVTETFPLMGTPYPVLILMVAYLAMVKYGPEFMKSREPFELCSLMRIYNVVQIAYNGYILHYAITHFDQVYMIMSDSCQNIIFEDGKNDDLAYVFIYFSWNYLMLKILDLIDTVFMVLRKKNSHISFLHVYHHSSMVISVWLTLSYIKPPQGTFPGLLNVFVHMVMYGYYLLATFKEFKKYLWWKIHLTKLQLIQFAMIFVYVLSLYVRDCRVSRGFTIISLFNVSVVFSLFVNFYIKAYITNPAQESVKPKAS